MAAAPMILTVIAVVLSLLIGYLLLQVLIFRISCQLCGVPAESIAREIGIMAILLVVTHLLDAFLGGILYEIYTFAGYPLWEAALVLFFLALPIHMLVATFIHAKLGRVSWSRALAVWFVDKMILFTLFGGILTLVVLVILNQ